MVTRRHELGEFLRARRQELSPAAVGIASGAGHRRVPGLRRAEVAGLAAISEDYYTRIEQGRRAASRPVLETLARVLQLSGPERGYLLELSGAPSAGSGIEPRTVEPQLLRLLEDLRTTPGIVVGPRTDVLAWNAPAVALFVDFARVPAERRNFVRLVFTEPAVRDLYVDWPDYARACVGQLRRGAAEDPDDPGLAELVADLSALDDDFRRWWGDHRVGFQGAGRKVFRHPVVGDLALDWSLLASASDPRQHLVTFTAAPGTPDHEALARLAAQTA